MVAWLTGHTAIVGTRPGAGPPLGMPPAACGVSEPDWIAAAGCCLSGDIGWRSTVLADGDGVLTVGR